MHTKLLPGVATTFAVISLVGCYPAFLTSRPRAKIVVTDESGAPLGGATVTLGTLESHGVGGRLTQQDFRSDLGGRVEIDSDHVWAMQILLPDGDVSYYWSLCVSRPGFEAVPVLRPNFRDTIKVAMYSSAVNSECKWQLDGSWPRVEERMARWIEVEGGKWQSNTGITMILDEDFRPAMEASAREQGIQLHSWSEYRFQYRTGGDDTGKDSFILIRALCRAPVEVDLTKAFYSEPRAGACYFDTKYTRQVWVGQPKPSFGPLRIVAGEG
jgi:hypothetical protein